MLEVDEAQNVGELLRNTRLKKGKTLGDVSKDLCIRKFYLEAIENLSAKDLPPVPYGLGFVRSYAEYLGLNSPRIVQAYRQAVYAEQENEEDTGSEENTPPVEYAGPNLRHVIIGLVGVVLIFAVWRGVSSYNQEKQLAEEKEIVQNDVVPEPVIIEENEPALADMGLEDVEAEKTEADAEPAAAEKTAEKEPVKTEAENVKAAEKNEPAAQPEAEETKTAAAEPAAATPTKIRISFAGPSWLELKQGDKVLLSGIYSKGFKYDVPNERGIIVSVGRYYNVDFYVDGKLTKIASAMKQTNISLDKYILPEQKQE
ncbi:MAG: helix-turn-helix domain-containing protein [Alphaproteobacteria bacterium]